MGLITPTLPTTGQSRGGEEVDVLNALTALLNLVNGQIDGANVAAALLGEYRTIVETHLRFEDTVMPAGIKYAISVPDGAGRSVSASGDAGNKAGAIVFPFDPADYAIAGKTPKLRLRGALLTNAVAPALNFTCGMHLVSSTGGGTDAMIVNLAAAVAGSTFTRNAPAASSVLRDVTSDFTPPAAGVYALAAQTSVNQLAASAAVAIMLQLQLHYV